MSRTFLKSKIHRATVTKCDIDYEGSISICPLLMEAADLLEYEKVLVVDVTNGARLETYVIEGDTGEIGLNGAAARLVELGDKIIIMSFEQKPTPTGHTHTPTKVFVEDDINLVRLG